LKSPAHAARPEFSKPQVSCTCCEPMPRLLFQQLWATDAHPIMVADVVQHPFGTKQAHGTAQSSFSNCHQSRPWPYSARWSMQPRLSNAPCSTYYACLDAHSPSAAFAIAHCYGSRWPVQASNGMLRMQGMQNPGTAWLGPASMTAVLCGTVYTHGCH
jgi:hypothetical protein